MITFCNELAQSDELTRGNELAQGKQSTDAEDLSRAGNDAIVYRKRWETGNGHSATGG